MKCIIKLAVSREDGSPIYAGAPDPYSMFLTDVCPLAIVKKDGGTVEAVSGDIYTLLEFTARQLEGLGVRERRNLCDTFGLK